MTSHFKPLRLTWRLSSPLAVSGNPIHLDALVAFAKTQQALSVIAASESVSDQHIRSLADSLPLEKEQKPDSWVWKASALMPTGGTPITQGMRHFTRRTDTMDIAIREGQQQFETLKKRERRLGGAIIPPAAPLKPYGGVIDTARGLTKNVYKFYATKHIKEVSAWCVGDPEELDALLNPAAGFISYLGARRRSGHGFITDFQMVEDASAFEMWSNRALPWNHEDAVQMEIACHPPYWAPENRELNFINPSLFM